MAAKNNLKPKPYATNNIDRWGYLTGTELNSLNDYTRDQLRAIAVKYGIKNASRKSGDEVITLIEKSDEFKKINTKKKSTAEKRQYKTIFEKIEDEIDGKTKSIIWYRTKLKSMTADIQAEPDRMTQQEKFDSIGPLVNQDQNVNRRRVFPGHLCFFEYKAETQSLPYYDKYPLVYILKVSGREFWGANLHYLAPSKNRRELVVNKLLDGKIDIPRIIIHKYLYKRCKSLFLDLAKQEWDTASALPVEDFVLMKGDGKIEYPREYVWAQVDQYWNDRIKGTRIVKGINRQDIERVK